MIRKLKVLGLAVVAVLALSAVASSTASATNLTTANGTYPATLHAVQEGTHEFVVNGRTLTCSTVTFSGSISGPSSNTQVTPKYENCHTIVLGATWPVTVTTNGCTYTLTSTPANHVTIDCPAGQNIDIHVYSSEANHKAGTSVCTYHVGSQTISSGISYVNNANGTVNVNAAAAPVALTLTSGSALTCGATNQTSSYSGKTVTSATVGGVATAIHQK